MKTAPQPGIVRRGMPYSIFLILTVKSSSSATAAVRRLCGAIPKISAALNKNRGTKLACTASFGAAYWKTLSSRAPKMLRPFAGISGKKTKVPSTGGDIFLHINSAQQGVNFACAKELLALLDGHATVKEEVHSFVYLDSRDLTGFIDGTANPKGKETAAALVDDDPRFNGGSYVLTQRYVHDLEKWKTVPVRQQERVIGRTKKESLELDPKPADSHISRAEIVEKGKELKIVRHSMPYGAAGGKQGLFFVAYAKDPAIFEAQLDRMFGAAPDGMRDKLMNFTRPETGAFFFAPSLAALARLARPKR